MTVGQSSTEEWITTTPSVLDGKPRVKNTRLGVHFLATQVLEGEEDPYAVAEKYGVSGEAVRAAVDYYQSNPEKMASIERQRKALFEEAEQNPGVPTSPAELAEYGTKTRSASD